MGNSSYRTVPDSSLMRQVPQPPNVHSCGSFTAARTAASSTDSSGSTTNASSVSRICTRYAIAASLVSSLFFDVGLHQHFHAARLQQFGQCRQGGQAGLRVLFAVAAAQAHAADHLVIHHDRKAADEHRELAVE